MSQPGSGSFPIFQSSPGHPGPGTVSQPGSGSFPIFQSSPGHPGPGAVSQPGSGPFPVFFQSSPSLPARPPPPSGFVRFPPSVYAPPSHLQRPTQHPQRGTQFPTGGYPQPTYSAQPRPQTNARFPNPTTHNSPWRGGEGGGGFPSFFQPGSNHQQQQQQPTTFLQQTSPHSSPRSSPSLFEKKTPGVSGRDTISGPSSLPASPAKGENHNHRASSVQPAQAGATSSYSALPSLLIARPRPSPPHSVPPPNQTHKTNPDHGPSPSRPTTGRDSDNLMEFSVSPSLLSPSKTRQPSSTLGPTPQVSSPAGSSFLSSNSKTRQPSSTQGPTPSPAGSSYLSSTTDSDTSRETSPYGGGESSSGLSEEDLIQWALSPDFLQKVQKYRGRQGLRQGWSDSLRR